MIKNLIYIGVYRGVVSIRFVFSVVLYVFVLFQTVITDYIMCDPLTTPVYYFLKLAYISSTQGFVLVFVAFPSTYRYCEDSNNAYYINLLIRSNAKKYIISLYVSNAIIVFLTTFASELLFLGVLGCKYQFNIESGYIVDNLLKTTANSYILEYNVGLFYFLHILQKSSIGIIYSSFSIFLSLYVPNVLFVSVLPLFLYTVTSNVLPKLGLPYFMMPTFIFGERSELLNVLAGMNHSKILSTVVPHLIMFFLVIAICFVSYRVFKSKLLVGELS